MWLQAESAGQYSLVVEGVVDKVNITGASTSIQTYFVPTAYHQLLVTKSGSMLAVALDGVSISVFNFFFFFFLLLDFFFYCV